MNKLIPRGIRLNNPGNIRHGQPWRGLSDDQPDKSFAKFKTPEMGIRAAAKVLRTYEKRGLNTIQKIIGTWAPPNENDTDAYVNAVAKSLGVKPTDTITLTQIILFKLAKAIIRHENGENPYSDEQIMKGVSMAMVD